MDELRQRTGVAARALEFLILTATRTSEALNATWDEFDLEAEVWTIPAARMKARVEHRVPLSRRATGDSARTEGARRREQRRRLRLRRATRRNSAFEHGAADDAAPHEAEDITAHGFRSTFSDWASEVSSFSGELRETALAHTIQNKAERAYRRGDALEKRREMMEAWANWCLPRPELDDGSEGVGGSDAIIGAKTIDE